MGPACLFARIGQMPTIVVIAKRAAWEQALKAGEYTQSTIRKTLAEVGFIHCSLPDQTVAIANRHFAGEEDLMLLLIDETKVHAPIQYEGAQSGRSGIFPHIYGALNTDAVYKTVPLPKSSSGAFAMPEALKEV